MAPETSLVSFYFPSGVSTLSFLKGRVVSSRQEELDIHQDDGVLAAGKVAMDKVRGLLETSGIEPQNAHFEITLSQNVNEDSMADYPWFASLILDIVDATSDQAGNDQELSCEALDEYLRRLLKAAAITDMDKTQIQLDMIKGGYDFLVTDKATINAAFQLKADGIVGRRRCVVFEAVVNALIKLTDGILQDIYGHDQFAQIPEEQKLDREKITTSIADLLVLPDTK